MAAKRIRVGSLNTNKIDAVREVFPGYEVTGVACKSGVREQPMDIDEIIKGAIIRARSIFGDCEYISSFWAVIVSSHEHLLLPSVSLCLHQDAFLNKNPFDFEYQIPLLVGFYQSFLVQFLHVRQVDLRLFYHNLVYF